MAMLTASAVANPHKAFPLDPSFPVETPCTGASTLLTLTGTVYLREQLTRA